MKNFITFQVFTFFCVTEQFETLNVFKNKRCLNDFILKLKVFGTLQVFKKKINFWAIIIFLLTRNKIANLKERFKNF